MTERLSFTDMELLQSTARVTRVDEGILYLDRSPFYPRGGGQPGDRGVIRGPNGTMTVTDTLQNRETGDMFHVGTVEGSFAVGDEVTAEVDAASRSINTRAHSAGHIIDIALEELQPGAWTAGRGYHFPEGPYVAYTGTLETPPDTADLEAAVQRIIDDALPRRMTIDGTYRTIAFGEHPPVGCGGTHVQNTADLGMIRIRGARIKKGELLIKYSVE